MNTRTIKIRTVYSVLAVCLSTAPAALGQTPQLPSPASGVDIGGFPWQKPPTQKVLLTVNPAPLTPELQARLEQTGTLSHAAASSLHAGHYSQAETEARQAISVYDYGVPEEVLAAALDAQGKNKEAFQAYQTVVEHYDKQPRNLLPYALLLLKSGQWKQALAVYNQALPHLPSVGPHPETPVVQDGDVMRANSHFSPDVPEPAALATAIHIARGLVYNATPSWAGESQNKEAAAEYGKALQLAPDSALANYYYGVGWQQLSPAERTKAGGSEQQAKAALQKAVLLGEGDVKKAAQRALKGFKEAA